MNAQQNRAIFLISGLAAAGAVGCLAPPQNCADANAANAAATGAATPATPAAVGAAATVTPGDLSKPLVVWNGDDVNPTAKQWVSCDTQPCTATIEPAPKVGANGSTGLEFKVKTTKGWAGFGWNWTSWYAPGAANVAGRKRLELNLKIVPASPERAPNLDAMQVGVRCAKQEKCDKTLAGITKYEPKAMDGQWHRIVIPLEDMKPNQGSIWDDGSAWELNMGHWAPDPREFVVYIDDITFE